MCAFLLTRAAKKATAARSRVKWAAVVSLQPEQLVKMSFMLGDILPIEDQLKYEKLFKITCTRQRYLNLLEIVQKLESKLFKENTCFIS